MVQARSGLVTDLVNPPLVFAKLGPLSFASVLLYAIQMDTSARSMPLAAVLPQHLRLMLQSCPASSSVLVNICFLPNKHVTNSSVLDSERCTEMF